MKAIILLNNQTNSCEETIISRDLSAEEIMYICKLVNGQGHYTVHIAEVVNDKPIPFDDITELLNSFLMKLAEE